jgi:type I restriction enzyme M protein
MGKLKDKLTLNPSPFNLGSHKTERTAVSVLTHWMREIIKQKDIDLGAPDVETGGQDRKMPDAVIYESRHSQNVLCVIEAKGPWIDAFDDEELKEPARKKANQRKAKYFALTNFKKFVWYSTEKVNAQKPEEEQILDKYNLSELENLDDIEQTRYSEPIKRNLERFLTQLYEVHTGKITEPRQSIDEFLIYRLHEKIRLLAFYYRRIIYDLCHKDVDFCKKLTVWFGDQGWSFSWSAQDFEKAARQTAYLLVNKILFYNILQAKRPQELGPLDIPEGLIKGSQLQKILQSFFDEVLKIDYETIYTTDFIDTVAFPDAREVVKEIKELIRILKRYDFSKLGFDIIGRIFERLIPGEERHNLGQYFTSPDIVDLILKFCLHHENDKIMDPACGAGTFLVRAYQHKKMMNQRKNHEEILDTLWGIDIAKFPAHLSTINLAINDLGVEKNYPNILHNDFFSFVIGGDGFDPENFRKKRAKTLGITEREVNYPRWFDAVVGNPPYTRQEEIPDTGVDKEKLIENALKLNNRKIAEIGKRAGIHAYFFVHGSKFLKDKGHFGFIVSNSWLDVDYGKGLQEFFLKNFKIIAIIESKVERWFAEADINTCIVILQKCKDPQERENHPIRFVYLKKSLRHFIPPAQDMWEKQLLRINEIDKLIKTIMAHDDFYENDDLRIFPKKQQDIWDEGFDREEKKYLGSKWGKYLRAPEIFFKILKKSKDKLVPLKSIADIRRGFTTGANEFFYLTEAEIKSFGIEKEFWMHRDKNGEWVPNYLVESPANINGYFIKKEDLKKRVLLIHKEKNKLKNKNVWGYIKKGEEQKFSGRETCEQNAQRKNGRWYDLDEISANLLWPEYSRERLVTFYSDSPVFINNRLYGIFSNKNLFLAGILNSTVVHLIAELTGPQPGGGGGPKGIRVYDLKSMFIPFVKDKKIQLKTQETIKKMFERKVLTIFEELGVKDDVPFALELIKNDRRELDKIIMGDILGLNDEEQLDVYRAVIDLVKSRIDKAQSFGKKGKIEEGVDLDAIKKIVLKKITEEV